jgi:hypothetical protein
VEKTSEFIWRSSFVACRVLDADVEGESMKRLNFAVLSLATLLGVTPLMAANVSNDQVKMQKEAKVSMAHAREIALGKVPGGKIDSAELEREHGKLIYSFDIKTGKPGVTEVQVSAISGSIVSIKHESLAQEKAEQKQEAKEAAPKH